MYMCTYVHLLNGYVLSVRSRSTCTCSCTPRLYYSIVKPFPSSLSGTGLELEKDIQFINIDASAVSDPPNVTNLLKMNYTQVAVIFLKCDKTYVLILNYMYMT